MAYSVYCEQLGVKRQLGGSTGEMKRWYPRIMPMAARRGHRVMGCTGSPHRRAPREQLARKRREPRAIRFPPSPNDHVPCRQVLLELATPDFAKAFSCKVGQKLRPKSACTVW